MKNIRKVSKNLISFLLAIMMIVSIVPVVSVSAATSWYYRSSPTGSIVYSSSAASAWSSANGYSNGVFGILSNTTLSSTLEITKGRNITIELNGYVLNRGKTSAGSGHNVISVTEGSTLTVYGNTKASPATTRANTVSVWNGSSKENKSFTTGVITGGYNSKNGGGINVEKNATLNLYYTSVAGNRANTNFLANGHGGGVSLNGQYAKLNMYNSNISNNYAESDGGGIYVDSNDEYCTIHMENSNITVNYSEESGGGLYSNAKNFKLDANGNGEGSKNCTLQWNTAKDDGGGIYLCKTASVVSGLYIYNNKTSANGGGVYMDAEKCSVKNSYISSNTAEKQGGGIYNDNDENTLDTVTIVSNKSTKSSGGGGGGVFNYGTVDLGLKGKVVIKNNTSTTYGTDNLYMDSSSLQKQYFINDSLTKDSDVHVRYASGHPARLTFNPGTYDASLYTYDNDSSHYFKWYSGDESSPVSGEKTRNIFLVSGTKPAKKTAVALTPDSGKSTKNVGTYNNQPLLKGVVQFPATKNDTGDRETAFYYSDGYFTKTSSPTAYDSHLATMSANLALASMYSNIGNTTSPYEYRDKSNNFRQLMSDIGCKDEDIFVNDNNIKKPTDTSIGCGIASKDLPDGTKLVIIGVRGAGYEAEWASNVSIGANGEANGFRTAATTVYSELTSYLKRKGIDGSKAKFWISGFSRAGATSNLVAKRIVDAYDKNGVRTFAYPIEAPKGGLRSLEVSGNNYSCIHNVLNTNDIVPWVAPGEMGFVRYGVDHFVPGNATAGTVSSYFSDYGVDQKADNGYYTVGSSSYKTQKALMLKQLQSMNDDIVYDDYFSSSTINYVAGATFGNVIGETSKHSYKPETYIPEFFQKFQAWGFDFFDNATSNGKVTDGSKIRANYATSKVMSSRTSSTGKSFQETVAMLCKTIFSMSPEETEDLMGVTDGLVDRIGITNILKIYAKYINTDFSALAGNADFYDDVETIWNALTVLTTEDEAKGYHSLAEYFTEDELNDLHTAFPALIYPLLNFIAEDYEQNNQDLAGTLADNAMRLIQNHYPEVAISWMRSYDTFYTDANYGDDTVPVTLSTTYVNSNKPKLPAVEINNDESTLYSPSANVITVKGKDEVRIVPSDVSKKDTGVAFYYQFTTGTKDTSLHAFSDPFVLGDLGTGYADSNGKYTINVYTTHYDSWYSKTPSTFTLQLLNGSARFYVPTDFNGTDYTYTMQALNYGATYNIDALESKHTNTSDYSWKFKKWTVENDKGEKVAENLYKQYFGNSFNPASPKTTVTNLMDEDYKFIPVYEKTISNIAINFDKNSASVVPVTASCPTVESYLNAIGWTYDDNSGKYIANFNITLPEDIYLADKDNLSVTFNSVLGSLSNPVLTDVEVNGNIANLTVEFNGANATLLNQESGVTVTAVDDNTGQTLNTFKFFKYGSNALTIFAPKVESEDFIKWDNNSTNRERAVSGSTGEYTAHYCPVVDEIKIKLSKAPTAGESMPELESTVVNIMYDWYLSPVDIKWTPTAVGDKADYNTSYTATFTIDSNNLNGSLDGVNWQALNVQYKFADNLAVTVSDNNGEIQGVTYTIRSADGKIYLDCTFPQTAQPKVEEVEEVNVNVPNGASATNIKSKLPASVDVILSDYSVINVPVSWSNVPNDYNSASLDEQSFTLTGTLNTEYQLASGLSITANVNVSAAPMVAAPVAQPESGTYEGNQEIALSSETDATVYYAVKVMDAVGGDEVNQPEFIDSDYAQYSSPIKTENLENFDFGKEIIISAYAVKAGMNDSSVVTFRYVLNNYGINFVPARPAKIAEDGCIDHYRKVVSGSGTAEDPYEYEYYADKNGNKVLTYDDIAIPAFVKNTFFADAEDLSAPGFCLPTDQYNALEILGVQKKANVEEHDVRYISVVDTRILSAATDYGYVFSLVDTDNVAEAKAMAGDITVQNGTMKSCKSTANNVFGDYGNREFDPQAKGYTPYKYVTAVVKNMPATLEEPNGNKTVVARFYVKLENNEDYIYAKYSTIYDGCAVNYYKLDHPDA